MDKYFYYWTYLFVLKILNWKVKINFKLLNNKKDINIYLKFWKISFMINADCLFVYSFYLKCLPSKFELQIILFSFRMEDLSYNCKQTEIEIRSRDLNFSRTFPAAYLSNFSLPVHGVDIKTQFWACPRHL